MERRPRSRKSKSYIASPKPSIKPQTLNPLPRPKDARNGRRQIGSHPTEEARRKLSGLHESSRFQRLLVGLGARNKELRVVGLKWRKTKLMLSSGFNVHDGFGSVFRTPELFLV